jgi:Zn-dependent protease with chaperone function
MSHPWALGLVTSAAAFVGLRFTCLLWGHVKAQRVVARLRSLSEPIGRRAYLVPIDERFAFTAGLLSSTVFFSRAAWEVLRPEQREAILAHELAHIDHDDIRCRAALGCAASFGVPLLVRSALRLWERSTERICDREAALAVDRPSTVASAMLALIRPAPLRLAPEGSLHAAASDLPERIEAVLREEPSGERLSQLLVLALGAASASFAIACGAFVTPIHHALETILG